MKILKWQFLKPPISQEYFQPSLSCSPWHGDENTRSMHRLGIKPWKRETVGRVSNTGLWLDDPCHIWVHVHLLTHQLYLIVGQGNLREVINTICVFRQITVSLGRRHQTSWCDKVHGTEAQRVDKRLSGDGRPAQRRN